MTQPVSVIGTKWGIEFDPNKKMLLRMQLPPPGDARKKTHLNLTYLRRLTSDKETPPQNERTHFREQVNHRVPPPESND